MELQRIRSGDAEALGLLLTDTWAPLVQYLLTFLDSVEAAEDAAQEAFVRLWERRDHWESGSARAVVFRIGRNVALDVRRKSEVRRRWRNRPLDRTTSPPTPEEELIESEFLLRFHQALEDLPPRRREVFELVRLRGLSYRDVAEVLELSDQTVANQMSLAMKDLRHLLSEFLTEPANEVDRGHEESSNDA